MSLIKKLKEQDKMVIIATIALTFVCIVLIASVVYIFIEEGKKDDNTNATTEIMAEVTTTADVDEETVASEKQTTDGSLIADNTTADNDMETEEITTTDTEVVTTTEQQPTTEPVTTTRPAPTTTPVPTTTPAPTTKPKPVPTTTQEETTTEEPTTVDMSKITTGIKNDDIVYGGDGFEKNEDKVQNVACPYTMYEWTTRKFYTGHGNEFIIVEGFYCPTEKAGGGKAADMEFEWLDKHGFTFDDYDGEVVKATCFTSFIGEFSDVGMVNFTYFIDHTS